MTLSGTVLGTGLLGTGNLQKAGDGQIVFNGVTSSGISKIDLDGGSTVVTNGSDIEFGNSVSSATQLDIAGAGQNASLTVSGPGTRLAAIGDKPIDISTGSDSTSNVIIENGASFEANSAGVRFFGTATTLSNAIANLVVTGNGSTLSASSFSSTSGSGHYQVLDGANINVGRMLLGSSGSTIAYDSGWSIVEISGDGSRLDSTGTLELSRGTLSITDGGVMTGASITIARATSRGNTDFTALVSGAGSELRGATLSVGAGGRGVLTISDGGTVVVGGGTAAVAVGGTDPDADGTLNIGGAIGEAATAIGSLQASAINLANNGTLNFNHTDNGYNFDIATTGTGSILQNAGRTILNSDQSGFAGNSNISGGVLEVNNRLGGTVEVHGGYLTGQGTVGNTTNYAGGTISPGSNGIGTLSIQGDYTGDGGTLLIDTVLGDDSSSTDKLAISGDTSGSTNVVVTNLAGKGAPTKEGIQIIEVGGASNGAFSLLSNYKINGAGAVVAGAYAYQLYQGSVTTPNDGNWYLRSQLNSTPVDPVNPVDPEQPQPTEPATPVQPTKPLYQAGVPSYETYPQALLGLNGVSTLQQRVGNRFWAGGGNRVISQGADAITPYAPPEEAGVHVEGNGVWGRIEGAHNHIESRFSTSGTDYDQNVFKMQAGLDGLLTENENGTLIGGVFVQYVHGKTKTSSVYGDGEISTDGYGVGGTLTWYGNEGFYVDAQAHATWYDSDRERDEQPTFSFVNEAAR